MVASFFLGILVGNSLINKQINLTRIISQWQLHLDSLNKKAPGHEERGC